jgi:hypothetical protein
MISALPFAAALFVGVLVCLEIAWWISSARARAGAEAADEDTTPVDGAVYGLLALLVAFTFSGAATRFDTKRQLIGQEANAVGTAYLRLDLLPDETRAPLQEKFRRYLDSRLLAYSKLPDLPAFRAEIEHSVAIQGEIWRDAVAATRAPGGPRPFMILPPINDMIDITTTRLVAMQTHPPAIVFWLLALMSLISALLVGRSLARRKKANLLHMLVYAMVMAGTVYVILDLEYPRAGLIRIDAADQTLVDLRNSMK